MLLLVTLANTEVVYWFCTKQEPTAVEKQSLLKELNFITGVNLTHLN